MPRKNPGAPKLTVMPENNYYVTAENITIKRNTTANSARAMAINDTTLSFTADDAKADPNGTTTYTFTPIADAVYEVTIDFQKRINIADGNNHKVSANIKVGDTDSDSYEYNGTKYEPEVTEVVCDNVTLTKDKDFIISYPTDEGANTNVTTSARVIITGIGKYMNIFYKNFTITQRDINSVSATIPEKTTPYTFTYTGSDIKPTPTIKDKIGETDAITANDYTIDYNNENYKDVTTTDVKITITGKGNYKGTQDIPFSIRPKEMTADYINISNHEFNNGNPVEPKPTITYNGITLAEGTDYDIAYEDNVYSGIATATFTFKGNYTGTVEKKFNILNHNQSIHVEFDNPDNQWTTYYYKENLALVEGLEAYVVTGISGSKVNIENVSFIPKNTPVLLYSTSGTKDFNLTTNYNATLPGDVTPNATLFIGSESAQTISTTADQTVFVLLNGQFVQTKGGEIAANRCYLVVDNTDLAEGIITLDINKSVNDITILDDLGNTTTKATVTETTKGTLTIKPENGYYVTADDITIIRNANAGSARAQQIDVDGGKINVTAGDIVNNDDYTSTYTFTYDYSAAYQYQIIVKLKKATSIQDPPQPTITFTNPIYNGLEQKAKPIVADGENILKEGEDYVLIYPGDDYTKAGTGKNVTVYGIRKYCKDLSNNSYTIEKRNISNIKPVAKDGQEWKDGNGLDTDNPQVYFSGSAMELNFTDIVTYKDDENQDQELDLLDNDNLSKEITVTYSNNTAVGKATATIKSNNVNYQGSDRNITFQILQKELKSEDVEIADIAEQKYTGNAITPKLTIKYNGNTLVEGDVNGDKKDYTVGYSDNVNAGTATANITFHGNYSGSLQKTFQIVEAQENVTINFDSKNEWTTYYSTKNLSLTEVADELEAFVVTGIEGAKLTTASVDFIPKETPVLLHRKSGEKTQFSVMTASTKSLETSISPNSIFKGTLEDINISTVDADKTKFVLLNGQFVQTTTGSLGANRCYIVLSTLPDGVNMLTIGKPTDGIVILEEDVTPQQANIIGEASKSTNGTTTTLTVKANNGWYVEPGDITVVRSAVADKGRAQVVDAPQVDGNNVTVTVGDITTENEKFSTTYLFTYPYSSDYSYQVQVNFRQATSLQNAKPTITLNPESFEYDKTEKKPSVTVKIGDVTLKEGDDYVVSYENNILASTEVKGNVLIDGIRKYSTQVNKNFTISKRDINKVAVKVDNSKLTYTREAIEPLTITDIVGNEDIITEDEYTITYDDDDNVNAGTVKYTIEGQNNYQGKKEGTFTILPKDLTGKATIDPIADIKETGNPIEPVLSIKDGTFELTLGEDYEVEYTNNVKDGTAKASVKFLGNYKGTAETTFTITHVSRPVTLNIQFDDNNDWTTYFSDMNVAVPEGLTAYVIQSVDGKEITPKEVDFIPENVPVLLNRTEKSTDTFTGGTMPAATKFSDDIEPYSGFKGTLESIDLSTVSGTKFILLNNQFIQAVTGTLGAHRCYINASISGIETLEVGQAVDERVYLEEGKTSTAGGTAETSTPDENGLITLTIKPKANFYAEKENITIVCSASADDARAMQIDDSNVAFTAVDATADPSGETKYTYKYTPGYHYYITIDFQKCVNFTNRDTRPTVTLADTDKNFLYDGMEKTPKPTVIYNGNALVENTDYVVIYNNNKNAGTGSVNIKGIRHYSGEFIAAEFNIAKRSLTNSNVKVELKDGPYVYTRSAIEPEFVVIENVTIDEEEVNIISPEDYEVTTWENNIQVTTKDKRAKIALHGIRNYDDYKDIYFDILPKEINSKNMEPLPNADYTGDSIKPIPVIKDEEYTLVVGEDFDVTYKDNLYEGTAQATVNFKGNYKGTASGTFTINPKEWKREIDITFEDKSQWTTLYWHENLDISGQGLTAYVVTGHETGSTKLITKAVDFIPANTGILLYRANTSNAGPFYGTTLPISKTLDGVTPDKKLFVGTMDGINDLSKVNGVKFILVDDQFVQITTGTLAPHRCYANFGDGQGISDISTIDSDRDLDDIIIQEGGESRKEGVVGSVLLGEPYEGKRAIIIQPKAGFWADIDYISVIRTAKGETARAATVPSVDNQVTVIPYTASQNPSKESRYVFDYDEKYHYQITVDFQKCYDFTNGVTINLKTTTFEYDGTEKKPEVASVYNKDGQKLRSNYYTVSYTNNINAGGTARAVVTGDWYYYGENGVNFNISQRDISKATIVANIPVQVYTGNPIEIDSKYLLITDSVVTGYETVDGKKKEIKKNIISPTDYTLVYRDNVEVGTATVTVMPTKINYSGHGREYTFNIIMAPKGDANHDGLVNVTDIVEIVNYILGRPSSRFHFDSSDVNDDGNVNVTDIVLVVSIILSGDNSAATRQAIDEALAEIMDDYITAVNSIESDSKVDVYDLRGKKVRANATDLKGLPQGVYIIRDKNMRSRKVFIK